MEIFLLEVFQNLEGVFYSTVFNGAGVLRMFATKFVRDLYLLRFLFWYFYLYLNLDYIIEIFK